MSRLIPAAERIMKARELIRKARDLPVPAEGGRADFSYIAQVKDYLRQARELVKLPMLNGFTRRNVGWFERGFLAGQAFFSLALSVRF